MCVTWVAKFLQIFDYALKKRVYFTISMFRKQGKEFKRINCVLSEKCK